ncbi:MAG: hypothetical protein LBT02_03590 [Rickettsiales bacterium]|nr:hypothetical protein [Rickettsiales bacterium]
MEKKNIFKIAILLVCFLAFSCFAFKSHFRNEEVKGGNGNIELSVFVQEGCPHCMFAEQWLNTNPFNGAVNVVYYDIRKEQKNVDLLLKKVKEFGIPEDRVGTPVFVIGKDYVLGFSDALKVSVQDLVNKHTK